MALKVVTVAMEPELAVQDWLAHTDDAILACRGQGHSWPKLKPNKGKPIRGIRHHGTGEGQVELEFTCKDCGTIRRVVTAPGGMLDLPAHYKYVHPNGYRAPKGVRITPRTAFAESNRRWLEDVASNATAVVLDPFRTVEGAAQ